MGFLNIANKEKLMMPEEMQARLGTIILLFTLITMMCLKAL
jgi:hypothetical protein